MNVSVYEAFIGPDPEWTVTGTLAGYDPAARLARLQVPALVLTGRGDRITPPCVSHQLYRLLPAATARLEVFEDSAHRPWAEQPDEYFATVRDFLAGGAG